MPISQELGGLILCEIYLSDGGISGLILAYLIIILDEIHVLFTWSDGIVGGGRLRGAYLDGNGDVGLADLVEFAAQWME